MLGGRVHPATASGALALEVGDEGAEHRLARGLAGGLRAAHAHRRPVRITHRMEHAAHGLEHQLRPAPARARPRPAEGAHRGEDQARVLAREHGPAEPQFLERARRQRLEQKVRRAREREEVGASRRSGEVERDAARARGVGPPGEAPLRIGHPVGERRPPAQRAALGGLHSDHVGAEIGEHLARERAERAGEIEDAVRGQRAGDGGHGARRARKAAMARPISCGESSWMK